MKLGKGLHLHFDPSSGIAGDMTIAALIDAGVPRAVVTGAVAAMGVPGLTVKFERRQRGAYVGTGFLVSWPQKAERSAKATRSAKPGRTGRRTKSTRPATSHRDHDHDHDGHDHDHDGHDHDHDGHDHDHDHGLPGAGVFLAPARSRAVAVAQPPGSHEHRDYAEIRRLLKRAGLDPDVRSLAGEIFARIAEAESTLHGVPLDRIGFHEVGAYDSIADIVGAAAAIAWLAPSAISSSPPVLGSGSVRTAHGVVPVPAPATALLLQGLPVRSEGQGELTTPTGAAILASVVDDFADMPPVRMVSHGFGAGTRELADRPNVLRVMLGEPLGRPLASSAREAVLIESNIDDMNPQLVEPLLQALFQAGALDAWTAPIVMKKGRPALTVSVLAEPGVTEAVTRALFENSTTIGLRLSPVARQVLSRSSSRVVTRFGQVAVKLSALEGRVLSATPEFEDCRKLARSAGVPVRQVLAAASAAAQLATTPQAGHPARAGKR